MDRAIIDKLLKGDRNALSRLITLAESSLGDHQRIVHDVLEKIVSHTGNSVRLGITGAPGVGKSSFIESFGTTLTSQGKKVAVLSIDPSSPATQGSILGDKTRMENLSKDPNAFIRPTAAQNFPGGVAHATREAILLCEAAGFDITIVETVGVGQSEFSVKEMTDCFILLMLAGAGDELQGIKKGIMEMADMVLITKADGDNQKKAEQARAEFQSALHLLMNNESWVPQVVTCSAIEKTGLTETWSLVQKFISTKKNNGNFQETRKKQLATWMNDRLVEQLKKEMVSGHSFSAQWTEALTNVQQNQWTVFKAVDFLLGKSRT